MRRGRNTRWERTRRTGEKKTGLRPQAMATPSYEPAHQDDPVGDPIVVCRALKRVQSQDSVHQKTHTAKEIQWEEERAAVKQEHCHNNGALQGTLVTRPCRGRRPRQCKARSYTAKERQRRCATALQDPYHTRERCLPPGHDMRNSKT